MTKRHRALWIGWAVALCVLAVGCTSRDETTSPLSDVNVSVTQDIPRLSDANLLEAKDIPDLWLVTRDLPVDVWNPDDYNGPLSAHICDLWKFPAQSPLADLEHRTVALLGLGKHSVDEAVFADTATEIRNAYALVSDTIRRCVDDPEAWNLGEVREHASRQEAEYLSLSGAAEEGIAFTYRAGVGGSWSCTHRVAVVMESNRLAVVMLDDFSTPETYTDDDFRSIVDEATKRLTM